MFYITLIFSPSLRKIMIKIKERDKDVLNKEECILSSSALTQEMHKIVQGKP